MWSVHVVALPRTRWPEHGVTLEMTSHFCRGHLRGLGVQDRGAWSLELDETQCLMLTWKSTWESVNKKR